LLRYRSSSSNKTPDSTLPPLLVVYSLVNRPYILDLNDERSFIRALCDSGRDVYLIDWGYPREQDKDLGLHDYINRYLHACVSWLQNNCDAGTVDLVGICQGGPFALCYTALEPARVRRLVLMVAPVDFHTDDFLLARWLRHIDIDRLVSTLGNVPGHLLNWSFLALKPVSLAGMKALQLLDLLDCPRELRTYVQMEQWLQDNPDQAGRAFAEFTHTFVRDNALVNADARIGTRVVNLHAVRHKVLNIYAARDHIVPPSASRSLPDLLGNAQCTNRQMDCGHVGVFAGRRTHSEAAELVSEWFDRAD
jgi:polyhydroxyalkanoate synthase